MSAYDLESIQLPKLNGMMLKLFSSALSNPITRAALIGPLLKNGGITKLRTLRPTEAPTLYPLAFQPDANAQPIPAQALEAYIDKAAHKGPFCSITDYAQAYRSGKITPPAIAEKVLKSIQESDEHTPPLRAFIANDREDVLAQAKASAERIQSGHPLSILDGVPVAVKDEVDQLPYPTTAGTSFLGATPAGQDSTVVARLRAAGALLIGKANMHEIGINPNGSNVHYGMARNPYNLNCDTGGSSSGPAASVAAGLCPVAIGADGGGSIRIPSSLCGLVGLMSTFGRVSEFGAAPLCWSVGHLGPLGANVEDVALTYAAIAGPDPKDPNTLHQPQPTIAGWNNPDLSGMILGIYPSWFKHASPEVVSACEGLLDKLVQAGAKTKEIEIPELDSMRIAHVICILAEMAASMQNYREHLGEFGDSVKVTLTLGQVFTSQDYLIAQRIRTRAMHIFNQVLQEVDVIVTPATGMTAPQIPVSAVHAGWSDLSVDTEMMRYVFPGNLVGLPAITFPAGYDKAGLPIGMQVMGRPWDEKRLLQIAYAAEQVVDRKLSQLYYKIL
ncbi:MAG: amidase [Anaerolineaceae bacterium]|nr:amidase [Anaerolineaceae bacterium]